MKKIVALFILCNALAAVAQPYPNKAIRFIVPQPTGGTSDILGRVIAQKLAEAVKQPVIVDNRPGASGTLGSAIAAKAPPDGYTLLLAYTVHTTSPALYASLPFDPVNSFAAITNLAAAPLVLVVPPKLPVNTQAEFIRYARSAGRPLTFGSAGNGSGSHLAGELFRIMTGTPLQHIPYKGTGLATTELIGGQIDFMFAAIVPVQPYLKSGRLRGLSVTSVKRAAAVPDLPTVAEAGVPGFEYLGWYGMLAPAGTPREIVMRLHDEFVRIVHTPDMRERFAADGAEAIGDTPEQFNAYLKQELARWSKVIKAAGTKID